MHKIGRTVAPGTPLSEIDRQSVRQQLERMLASPLFRNSKRFPALWRYVVEQTLEGHAAELKERTLGVQVFGRDPDYDTNADPIVRVTAGEIRKRIAQYYDEEAHRSEVRIHLSPGSYVPDFEFPHPAADLPSDPVSPLPEHPVPLSEPGRRLKIWVAILSATTILSLAALGATWMELRPVPTALDRFWAPVLDSSDPVLICMGQRTFLANAQEPQQPPNPDFINTPEPLPGADKEIRLTELYHLGSQNVTMPDARTLGRIIGLLNVKGKRYKVMGEHATTLADLRAGPTVLVGAYNNDWTIRLVSPLRFSFGREGTKRWVEDRNNPANRDYLVDYETPYLSLTEDYAIVARLLDPTTERFVIVVAGLTGYGTVGGGEFVANPEYMNQAVKKVPAPWAQKNMEWVIATKVINGNSGPPRVVDQCFW